MNITIVGSGKVGRALGEGWRKAGHSVTFATREPAKAAALQQAGFGAVPLASADVSASDVIALAVPWSAVEASLTALGPLAGKVLIDTTDPHTAAGQLALGLTDSGAETVARLSTARVVKAFSTTGAANMADCRYPAGRLMMPIAGDDADAKTIVMALAADLGFEPVDVGPLAMSRYLEPLAMLWIWLAYGQRMGTDFGFALLRR
jgi:predicted dinucleotide-binding enzyme